MNAKVNLTGQAPKGNDTDTVPNNDAPIPPEAQSLRPQAPKAQLDPSHPAAAVAVPGKPSTEARLQQVKSSVANKPALGEFEAVIKGEPLNVVTAKGAPINFNHDKFIATTQDQMDCLGEFVDLGLVVQLDK